MEQLHAGHRKRLRELYRGTTPESFPDHMLLELLLSYAIPRKDVNPIAHRLIDTFGSLTAVLSATEAELCAVDGIGEQASTLLRAVFDLHLRLLHRPSKNFSRELQLGNITQVGHYALALTAHDRYETLRLLCLDGGHRLLNSCVLATGNKNAVPVEPRHIIEKALFYQATNIILMHNHPTGYVLPSAQDIRSYEHLRDLTAEIGIRLSDNLILGDRFVYSFFHDAVYEFLSADEVRAFSTEEYRAAVSAGNRAQAAPYLV